MSSPDSPEKIPTDREALAAVLEERARERAGADPEAEELLNYLEGRLSPEAEQEIQRRLVASPSASRKLLDLADLMAAGEEAEARASAEAEGEAPADLALHAAWRDLQGRLPGGAAAATAEGRREARTSRPGGLSRGLVALAASLFVAVLALGVWVWRLEQGGVPREGPVEGPVMASVETLELFEAVRSDRVPTVELGPDGWLQLYLRPPEDCPSYTAELAGAGPDGTHTERDLTRDELGLVNLLVRGEPGRYSLRILGCEPERELSTYGFEIVRPGNATSEVNED